jgi:hypothetical protein
MSFDAEKIYMQCKKGGVQYDEAHHCKLVLAVMNNEGTMSAFCVRAQISDSTFFRWLNQHALFHECYRIGCMIARENWEEEGRGGKDDEMFNIEIWKIQGAARYGVGKSNRVRIHIDAHSSPYEQYKQLMNQASMGDFTAAELKQLMESINIGIRAFESFELQKEVNAMKEDLLKMSQNNGNNILSIAKTA